MKIKKLEAAIIWNDRKNGCVLFIESQRGINLPGHFQKCTLVAFKLQILHV